jgi:hypothetical protein
MGASGFAFGNFQSFEPVVMFEAGVTAMPKKIVAPPKGRTPERQPVRRPDDDEAPVESRDRKQPCRDTRDTPAPNPNGESVEGPQPRSP